MIIGIDIRHLATGPYAGVAVVTRALVEALAEGAPTERFKVFFSGRKGPPPFVREWPKRFSNISLTQWRFSNRLFDFSSRTFRLPPLDRMVGGIDVLLSPHTMPVALSAKVPRVLIVHDLSFVAHPEFFSWESRLWHAAMGIRGQVRRARVIVVPSCATARDLERFWNIAQQKIAIVPWGSPRERFASRPPLPNPHGRFVLFVGTVEARKNVSGLVGAFEIVKRDSAFADLTLVIAGALGYRSEDVVERCARSPFRDAIILRGYVSEEEKSALLRNASLFVYPSLYEGFGLPVLEAMAEGVPVVTSQRTSLPEVAGNAAILVDPMREGDIAAAMRDVLSDSLLADELRREGRARAQLFRWDTTARRILTILHSLA
jgi:glycosyltransferase involved in cell wall biosynthesis